MVIPPHRHRVRNSGEIPTSTLTLDVKLTEQYRIPMVTANFSDGAPVVGFGGARVYRKGIFNSKPEFLKNTNVENLCGRDAGIFEFGPGSPYFVWNPSTSRGGCRMLYIPIHLVRECEHFRTRNSLFLIDEWGNEWETRIHKDRRRVWCNTKEWRRLCKKNRVRTGDVCVCELVQGRGRLCIHVRVIRFAGKRSAEEEDAEKVEEDEESAYKNVGGNQEELKDPYLIAAQIFKSGMAVRPKNPYYLWRCSGQNEWKNYLPKRIITYYQLKISDSLLLVDEQGNKWEAKIMKGGTDRMLCPKKAWRSLCKTNLVDIGDVCLCELVQGSNGIHMLVRVIRAHTLTKKKGCEEEQLERVGIDSESKSDDDESPLQMNIPEAKHKFKSGSSSARVSWSVKIENKSVGKKCTSVIKETNFLNLSDDDTDESDGDDSETEMDISKATHKLKSSCAPVRRSGRIRNTVGSIEESGEDSFEKIDKEALYSDPHEEMRWKRKAKQKKIETQDAYSAAGKKSSRVLKETTYLNLSDGDTDESDGDDSEPEMDISKAKHKLKSSHAPVRRSGRILTTFGGNKELIDPYMLVARIFKSGMAARPKNPYHVWRCSSKRPWPFNLPKRIITYYQLKISDSLLLVDERGNEWEAKIMKGGTDRMLCPKKAWGSLCKTNLVDIGDVCLCEFVQGRNGIQMLVRVIRDHTLTRKMGTEEENIKRADVDSEYEIDDDDDESPMQMNIPEAKHKLKSGSSSARVSQSVKIEKKFNETDESDGDDSETEMNISRANHKLKSSHAPFRRSGRIHNIFGGNEESGEDIFEKIDEEALNSDPHEETRWKRRAQQKKIGTQDAHSAAGKKRTRVLKEMTYLNLSDDDTDESDGDDSEMEMDISKEKHKLKSSFVPIRRSGRIHNAYAKKKRVEFSCEHDENESDECDGNIKPCTIKPLDRPNRIEGKLIGSLCLPKKLEWLHSYLKHVHEKDTIAISFHDDVFGKECKTYIFLEHLEKFCLLEPITDCCIIAYMWYLHRKMKRENILDRFRFVNLNYVSRTLARDRRTRAVFDRLTGASTNQLVLVPCNVGSHWILTAIHPYSETVFYLDSLYFRIHDEDWRDIVNDAISMFSASRGEKTKKKPSWKVVKAARQPDSKQCGFYVMLYMREIIEIFVKFGLSSLELRFKGEYSRREIDEVRAEWAEGVIDHLGIN